MVCNIFNHNYLKLLDNWRCIICPLDKVICSQCGRDQNGVQLLRIKCTTFCQWSLEGGETGITGSTITTKTSTYYALSYFTILYITWILVSLLEMKIYTSSQGKVICGQPVRSWRRGNWDNGRTCASKLFHHLCSSPTNETFDWIFLDALAPLDSKL